MPCLYDYKPTSDIQKSNIANRMSNELFQNLHLQTAGLGGGVVDPVGGFGKIRFGGLVDVIYVLLRIAVHQWEPCTLHLHHNPVAFFEGMEHILQTESNVGHFIGFERLRLLKAIPEAAPHDFAAYHLLVVGQYNVFIGHLRVIRLVGGIHIN